MRASRGVRDAGRAAVAMVSGGGHYLRVVGR